MMTAQWRIWTFFGKKTFRALLLGTFVALGACSTNPATGEQQFTALLPAEREASVGAEEHEKVRQTFGSFIQGPAADYVNRVGQKVAANTERKDVQYKFYVIDSPIVNAFAVPGGYIYVSRGLLALANNEAELAAVLAHEIGHITGRHAAERMSQGLLVSLGAAVLSSVVDQPGVGRAAGLGSDLYIKSYSRGQEHQADELGVRYLSAAGYNPQAMAGFLDSLGRSSDLDQKAAGKQQQQAFNYFSTHPRTEDRVSKASQEAGKYPGSNNTGRDTYLQMIDGLPYGDSASQGFIRGTDFYHTNIGFKFSAPKGTRLVNSPNEVVGTHANGSVIIFDNDNDNDRDSQKRDPLTYITQGWLKSEPVSNPESITINNMRAATAAFGGTVQGVPVTIRVVAIEWKPGEFFRFQISIPRGTDAAAVEALKKMTYSFRRLSESEKNSIQPLRVKVVTAASGDTLASMGARMAVDEFKAERFMVLNSLNAGQNLATGQKYKIVQ